MTLQKLEFLFQDGNAVARLSGVMKVNLIEIKLLVESNISKRY